MAKAKKSTAVRIPLGVKTLDAATSKPVAAKKPTAMELLGEARASFSKKMLDLSKIDDPKARDFIGRTVSDIMKFRAGIGIASIQLGEKLVAMKEFFESNKDLYKGMFVKCINAIPGFSVASAYRYIGQYTKARGILPKPVMVSALAGGFDIVTGEEGKPFGKFQHAVQAVIEKETGEKNITDGLRKLFPERPDGKLSEAEMEKAGKFLNDVKILQSKIQEGKTVSKSVDTEESMIAVFKTFDREYNKIPTKDQEDWLIELVGKMLGYAEMPTDEPVEIEPIAVGSDGFGKDYFTKNSALSDELKVNWGLKKKAEAEAATA